MKGYGHSMNRLAVLLMKLSSANMKSDLLTVRQFCRWGTGLYIAMVRARCALACLMEAVRLSAAASAPSPPSSGSPSPESTVLGAHSSPNLAILQRDEETAGLTVFHYRTTSRIEKCEVELKENKRIHLQSGDFRARRIPQSCKFLSLHIHKKIILYHSVGLYFNHPFTYRIRCNISSSHLLNSASQSALNNFIIRATQNSAGSNGKKKIHRVYTFQFFPINIQSRFDLTKLLMPDQKLPCAVAEIRGKSSKTLRIFLSRYT